MNWNYITGFFDADGYVTTVKQNKNENETIIIGFTNTKLEILEEIQNFISISLDIKGTINTKKAKKENHSISYDLKYVGLNKCKWLSDHILSIHPKKKARFELIDDFIKLTPRNGKYTDQMKKDRNDLVQKFLNIV